MAQERAGHAYRVSAWWTSGRTDIAKSDSAPNAIHFTAPKEFGGLEGRWTPEASGVAVVLESDEVKCPDCADTGQQGTDWVTQFLEYNSRL